MGVSRAGVDIMTPKSVFRAVRLYGVPLRAALVIKQEMLAKGGEAALPYAAAGLGEERCDMLLVGTLRQFGRLTETLKLQPFGLPAIAREIDAALAAFDGTPGLDSALRSGHLWIVAGVFFVAGVLLSLTPCVLPMLPILSSIIVGQSGSSRPTTRSRGLGLAMTYSLGMALVYTALGVAAGLAGEGLAASLQNPWVLGVFGAVPVGLALWRRPAAAEWFV